MKKLASYSIALLLSTVFTLGISSCSSDDDNKTSSTSLSEGDQLLQQAITSDVNNTINPTYKALADSYSQLCEALAAMKTGSITQTQVDAACKIFLNARSNYERSEAFLLGAASHFSIDPHIDSWPLDLASLQKLLTSNSSIATASNYDQSLIGFHGIEFILFRDGKNRDAQELNNKDTYNQDGMDFTTVSGSREIEFAAAVSEDLRNSVYQLECSWNENAPKSHFDILDNLGKAYTTDLEKSYGYDMQNAGNTGSTYTSVKAAVSAILSGDHGAAGIADEVGNTKINNPYSGADVSYIESPYSQHSLIDFQNNIHSIENLWYGGTASNRNNGKSFHDYFAKYNAETGKRVETAITNALSQINAIPAPFVKNYKNAQCAKAIAACQELSDALSAADQFVQKTNK